MGGQTGGVGAIGREEEFERVARVMAEVAETGAGRVVEVAGEAGIGKSALVRALARTAGDGGWQVWRTEPTEVESGLPWTALAMLLDDAPAGHLAGLLGGLDDALVDQLSGATSHLRDSPVSPELVAFALSALLDAASSAQPLLLVLDDVQWIDQQSAGAFAFALRRTSRRRCVAILAARSEIALPFAPERLVPNDAYARIELDGLGLVALREVIDAVTGVRLAHDELARVVERAGGNPLYAIELARVVRAGRLLDAAELPASLRETIGARIDAVPAEVRRVLAAAALATQPRVAVLRAALPDVDVLAALEAAEQAAVIELQHDERGVPVVVFRHPLLASVAIDTTTGVERRRLHAALAVTATDEVERARHLIACADGPDEDLAGVLEAAAMTARRRGAVGTAASLAAACVDLAPSDGDVVVDIRRRAMLVERLTDALRTDEAVDRLADVVARIAAAGDHADPVVVEARERMWMVDVQLQLRTGGKAASVAAARQALAEVGAPERRLRLQRRVVLGTLYDNADDGVAAAEAICGGVDRRAAGPLLPRTRTAVVGDDCVGAVTVENADEPVGVTASLDGINAALLRCAARVAAGHPANPDEAIGLVERADVDPRDRAALLDVLVLALVWTDHPRAEKFLLDVIERKRALGDVEGYFDYLDHLVTNLTVRGEWERARQLIDETLEYDEYPDIASTLSHLLFLHAAAGDEAGADAVLARLEGKSAVPTVGAATDLAVLSRAGQSALALGRPDAADRLLAAERFAIDRGQRGVRFLRFRRDLVEALVAAGRLDEAVAASDRLRADATRNAIPSALAESDVAAGVVAAAQGDHAGARERFAAAIATQRRDGLNDDLARTLLAAGASARRHGARSPAAQFFDEADALFAGMGAAAWARRVADERARLGVRRGPAADPAELTPAEQQTVDLVLAGKRNKEIAAALGVSVRMVETHLTRAYRKLGVRSRTELIRRLVGLVAR